MDMHWVAFNGTGKLAYRYASVAYIFGLGIWRDDTLKAG